MPEDYWPENLAAAEIVTPISIMREQAGLLGPKTNQQVTANVVPISARDQNEFAWSFQLNSTALGGYRYELFRVYHPVLLFPLMVVWENNPVAQVQNENAFRGYLKKMLTSEQTKKVVAALLAQTRSR